MVLFKILEEGWSVTLLLGLCKGWRRLLFLILSDPGLILILFIIFEVEFFLTLLLETIPLFLLIRDKLIIGPINSVAMPCGLQSLLL